MKFGLTRDSASLWLGMAGALVAYLIGSGEPPTVWDYGEWLQFAAASIASVIGVLRTSPLPHSEEGFKKITESGR